jgi:hypothetical protein
MVHLELEFGCEFGPNSLFIGHFVLIFSSKPADFVVLGLDLHTLGCEEVSRRLRKRRGNKHQP